jgi:hypothetical protein
MPTRPRHPCTWPGCPALVPPGQTRCPTHTRPERRRSPGATTARGYGTQHQAVRRELLPTAVGSRCTRCGAVIRTGEAIDLDHADDRRGYLGWAHRSCNRRAAGRRGGAARSR